MELERYIHKYHPTSGLKGEPHIKNKMRYWKRCYGSIALLKTQSGLGFQYSDGTIIVDDPKHWIDFIKVINIFLLFHMVLSLLVPLIIHS